ncbi:MAG: molecular chaperone GrpE [Blastocatellia bacterium]|jgi:molecular chaperone GrpE|nr:molecular chaperone GrpE [Blastocatellia bacterium]
MATNGNEKKWNSIPVRFFDEEGELEADSTEGADTVDVVPSVADVDERDEGTSGQREPKPADPSSGPMLAELVATRAELKRVESELADIQDRFTRRQADFENYRKRTERDRGESHSRATADVINKFLPVIDNLRRALEAERSLEASESAEFKHFLHGVELINKQLEEVLESLGVEVVPAHGARFDPHLHEAVVTEPNSEYEPDTVIQEMVRGYRLGDKLLRPAMVKVSTEPSDDDK